MKTQTYQVQNNRILFKCTACNAKRSIAVPRDVRRRSIRCHKCSTRTNCHLNRRTRPREMQAGKCLMITSSGKIVDITLHDISMHGVGFDLPVNALKSISPEQQVRFKCVWNPRLFGSSRYIIRTIKGRRVGAEKIMKNEFF